MCTQPFVFMSNEMRPAIIRGRTEVVRGGLTAGGEEEEEGGVEGDGRKGWQERDEGEEGG